MSSFAPLQSPNRGSSQSTSVRENGAAFFKRHTKMCLLIGCLFFGASSIIFSQNVIVGPNDSSFSQFVVYDDNKPVSPSAFHEGVDMDAEFLKEGHGTDKSQQGHNSKDVDNQHHGPNIRSPIVLDHGNSNQKMKPNNDESPQKTKVQSKNRRRMNVLILYPDDWRYNSIGDEDSIIKTPFLTSLAKEGMRFRQNAVTTSICWQSRATLFSGQWASRHRSFKLRCPHFTVGKAWNQTWPAILRRDGYYVGHIGKWQYHNSDLTGSRFDWGSFFEGEHWYHRGNRLVAGEDLARDETIRFLNERPKNKPFALTVAFYPPKPIGVSHLPGKQWEPKNETRAIYENITIPEPPNSKEAFNKLPPFLKKGEAKQRWNQRYLTPFHYQEAMKNMYALITQVDQACKEIVDELKKRDLYDNTLIIFTVDNGMFNGAHGLAGKWYPYQESIRVPLIIYDPRMPQDKRGIVDDSFTLNVDLAETILGAAGLGPHERMQGRDMSDLYLPKLENGKTALERNPWRDEFFYEFTYLEEDAIPSSNALVRKKWKFIDWYKHNYTQLFDLENDPMEVNDVKDHPANKEIVKEMRARLIQLRESLREPDIGCEKGTYLINAAEATPKK